MISCQRPLFDIPDPISYLNCSAKSPLLQSAKEAALAAIERAEHPWLFQPSDMTRDLEKARGLFARIINASADDVAIVPSASYGITLAAKNLRLVPGVEIVTLQDQFPSNMYPWRETAKKTGAALKMVARPSDYDWTPAILDAIGRNTAVVALPLCHWTDGSRVDVSAVSERAKSVGAALVMDATQSAGAMPIDVKTFKPDFLVASCYKWLFGPYSLGFLYVDSKHHGGEPLEYGWMSRAGSEDHANLVRYTDDYQAGARRFDMGERSQLNTMPIAVAGMEQILKWGVDAIQKTLAAKTDRVEERARALGLNPVPKKNRVGHIVGLRFPKGMPDGLLETLNFKKVYVSVRGDAIRVSPHVYNTDADVERLFEVLKSLF
jgi:selenocysteine lyase/cysteine desulfurase